MKRLLNGCPPWIQFLNSIDSILEDKELMKMQVELQTRFPIYHVCPKCLAVLLCGAAIRIKASIILQVSDVVVIDTG